VRECRVQTEVNVQIDRKWLELPGLEFSGRFWNALEHLGNMKNEICA
jgi:hypothetical protein